MSRSLSVLGFMVLVLSASCAPAAVPVDVEAERAALSEADSRYGPTGVSKDLEAFVAFYAPGATIYPPEGAVVTGLESIRTFMSPFMVDTAFTATFRPLVVEVSQSGDMGYTLNDAELTFTGPDGNPVTERLRDFHLWRKQPDGTWKIVVDIWNAEPPATIPNP